MPIKQAVAIVALTFAVGLSAWSRQPVLAQAEGPVQLARQTTSERRAGPDNNRRAGKQHCAVAYHTSLQSIGAGAGARLQKAAGIARRGRPFLPGYWLFWQPERTPVRRRRTRIGAPSVIVVEDRICTRSVLGRGGRIRCLQWQPKPRNFRPPKPRVVVSGRPIEPSAAPPDLARLKALTAVVRSGGAVEDLRRPGRLHTLTKRAGGELLGYLGQEFRPTICTGGPAMIDFYTRQLTPLTLRIKSAERIARVSAKAARAAVARARDAWHAHPQSADSPTLPTRPDTVAVKSTDGPHVAPDLSSIPTSLGEMVLANATVMLPRELIGHIRDEPHAFARLVRAREAMTAAAVSEAPPRVFQAVFAAFRGIEIAYYAKLNHDMIRSYGAAMETLMRAISESHRTNCICD